MRSFSLILLALLAIPVQAQPIGERTRPAATMLPTLGLAPGDDDLRDAIAAADRYPLGSIENPVRVGGPDGERVYLSRLRCPDRTPPRIGARGNGGTGGFGSVVNTYALDCRTNRSEIAFDIYHQEHVEERAPPGLVILPR